MAGGICSSDGKGLKARGARNTTGKAGLAVDFAGAEGKHVCVFRGILIPRSVLMGALLSSVVAHADFPGSLHTVEFDSPPISYSDAEIGGPMVELQNKLASGEIKLEHHPRYGYLPAVLKALNVPAASQLLVFSKTSTHRQMIYTNVPRAIYFNDDVYVGWTPGANLLELSSVDPRNGGVFHGLDQAQSDFPLILRNDKCLECHVGSKTMGVPGHLVRSFHNSANGWPNDASGYPRISHNAKYKDRWGGWYITGSMANNPTRANLINPSEVELRKTDPGHRQNLTDLGEFFDTGGYLSPHSDMVAMLVLEHQTHVHNFITRLNYEARIFQTQYGHIRYLESPIEYFVRHLLFMDEPPLPGAVEGTSGFAKEFEARGPKDSRGRSLREFDLKTRLFKHPCSFLIYSDAFDGMVEPLKKRVYERLFEVLSGKDKSGGFEALPPGRSRAILEILRETKPELPDYWRTPDAENTGQ